MSYWEKLTELRVYSQKRCWERYQICFLQKLSQGFIEGHSVKWQLIERRGRYVIPNRIPRNAPSIVEKARERSMGVHGAHICNILTVLGPKKLVSPDSPHPPASIGWCNFNPTEETCYAVTSWIWQYFQFSLFSQWVQVCQVLHFFLFITALFSSLFFSNSGSFFKM